jgi:hypothetical protein
LAQRVAHLLIEKAKQKGSSFKGFVVQAIGVGPFLRELDLRKEGKSLFEVMREGRNVTYESTLMGPFDVDVREHFGGAYLFASMFSTLKQQYLVDSVAKYIVGEI